MRCSPPPAFPCTQAHIPFPQSRVDSARIARRKAATAAIAARAYMPPSVPVAAPPAPARGLLSTGAAPQQQQQQAQPAPARTGSGLGRTASGQASLLNFGFTVQPRPAPAAAGGPEGMDMD